MTHKASTGLRGEIREFPAGSALASVAEPTRGTGELGPRSYAAGVAACAVALAVFSLAQLGARAAHEDEALALFVGRDSLGGLLGIVLGERGGAPLHFLLAWLVVHLGGGLDALRLVSAACSVAALPVVAALGSRLAGRTAGLAATVLVAASSVVLNQAVFGRMYGLFLLTSALSYLALLDALEAGGRRRWARWGIAVLLTVASHPYGLLVLASQGLYVLVLRRRVREAALAFGAVLVAGTPFWVADVVLTRRFDVGVGGRGAKLGAPGPVAGYLRGVAGDFTTRSGLWLALVLVLALAGLVALIRTRRPAGLLVTAVFAVPTAALLSARLGNEASPESRHLIFALPFLSLAVAAGLVAAARGRVALVALGLAAIVALQIQSARRSAPALFAGEAHARSQAREAAAVWLADTALPDDVLFGYEPAFLLAWERNRAFSDTVVPRADGRMAASVLERAPSLGRGIWILDAGDASNRPVRTAIPLRVPQPGAAFEARAFGPFLVVRTRAPTVTPRAYLRLAASTMRLGRSLAIADDDANLRTLQLARERLR